MDDLLSRVFDHQGTFAVFVTLLLLILPEVGYRVGLRLYAAGDEARKSQLGALQGALLGMLGLLLGFTFSMAVERYDQRRQLVVIEANAIGTAWLRAGLLPGEHPQPVKDLLRDYVDVRLRAPQALRDPALLNEGLRRSAEIQATLWRHAEASAKEEPNDITATFIESMNSVIDTHAERLAASRRRIPTGVWLILVLVAAVGCWTSAYASGSQGVRSGFTSALLPLLIAVLILLIFDLTNERHGIIGVSQQPLIDLQSAIRREP
jgi:hypothetical protein